MKDHIPPGGTVLPFQSRNVRHSDEELSTDDVEVVQHVRNAARVAPSSNKFGTTQRSTGIASERAASSRRNGRNDRPQIPAPIPASTRAHVSHHVPQDIASFSESEDEMTCLMPSKMILPPASKRGNEMRQPEMRSMEFRPQPQSRRAQPMYSPSTPQPMRSVSARQESMISHSDSVIHHHIPAPPASLAPMAMPSVDSERFMPGATVLTSRSLAGRPTVSWAAALVVMGIFAGLVTAAVARGDLGGDAKVAAASQPVVQQVIPSQQPASSPAMMGSLYGSGTTSSMAVSSPMNAAPIQMQPQMPVVQPVAQQPVAVSAPIAARPTPATRVVSHPHAAAPAPVARVAAADPKPEVKEAKEPKEEKVVATKSKKGSKGDDLASAKEAQALADAQLAASL
jgi:hypothetical protein